MRTKYQNNYNHWNKEYHKFLITRNTRKIKRTHLKYVEFRIRTTIPENGWVYCPMYYQIEEKMETATSNINDGSFIFTWQIKDKHVDVIIPKH